VFPALALAVAVLSVPATAGCHRATATVRQGEGAAPAEVSKTCGALPERAVLMYRREGGVLPTVQQWTFFPTGRFTGDQRVEGRIDPDLLEHFICVCQSRSLPDVGSDSECRDCYRYEITCRSGNALRALTLIEGSAATPSAVWAAFEPILKAVREASHK